MEWYWWVLVWVVAVVLVLRGLAVCDSGEGD